MREQIEDAEELIAEQVVLIDLLQEENAELQAALRVAKAQIQALMKGQKVEYEVA